MHITHILIKKNTHVCICICIYAWHHIHPAGCGIARVGTSPWSKNDNSFSVSLPSQSCFFFLMSFFLRLATLPHEIRTFFCLASFSDHCACRPALFFATGQDTTRFPSPLPGSNVLIDPGIETVSRFCTDWGRDCCLTQLQSWVNATSAHTTSKLSLASVACSTSNESSHPHPTPCSA